MKKMKDPYEVLGVPKNASQEQIKAAYRELAKKYHPDKYQNNPLADLAEEKLKDINEAYNILTSSLGGGSSSYESSGSYGGSYSYEDSSEFNAARIHINRGNLMAAETILRRSDVRNAEWYFLNGMISMRKGWYDQALSEVQQAVSMDPDNYEYRNALDTIMRQQNVYRNAAYGRGYSRNDDLCCTMCQAYLCFDCLCGDGSCM